MKNNIHSDRVHSNTNPSKERSEKDLPTRKGATARRFGRVRIGMVGSAISYTGEFIGQDD